MDMLPPAAFKLVINEGVYLSALADARPITVPLSLARTVREYYFGRLPGVDQVLKLNIRDAPLDDDFGGNPMTIRHIRRLDRRHRRGFNHVCRMRFAAAYDRLLHAIRRKDSPRFDLNRSRRRSRFKLPYAIPSRSSDESSRFAAHRRIASGSEGSAAFSPSQIRLSIRDTTFGRSRTSRFQVCH